MVSRVEDTIDTFSHYGRLGLDFITVSTITATTISRCSTNSVLPTPNQTFPKIVYFQQSTKSKY